MRQIHAPTVDIYLGTFHFLGFLEAGCWEESGGCIPSSEITGQLSSKGILPLHEAFSKAVTWV